MNQSFLHRVVHVTCIAFLASAPAWAQSNFPDKTIRLVVPQSPGSGGDVIARLMAQYLAKDLQQAVVVENRAGANGVPAAVSLAKDPADGYSLMLGQVSQLSFNELLYKDIKYSGFKDFTFINPVVEVEYLLVASKKSGLRSVVDIRDKARSAPRELNYASVGPGSMSHLAMELISNRLGVALTHVPYKGSSPALTSVIAGETEIYLPVVSTALAQAKSGDLTPLAVVGKKRLAELPNVPLASELQMQLPFIPGWYVLVGPANMPPSVTARLAQATQRFLKDPASVKKMEELHFYPIEGSGTTLKERAISENRMWGEFIRSYNIQVN